jgi:hypothetical protein
MPKDSKKTPGKNRIPVPHPTPGTTKGNDSQLVLTPGGWRPKSQVHRLEPGHHISGKGGRLKIIETATGNVVKDLGETSKKPRSRADMRKKKSGDEPFPDNGWIENTGWLNSSSNPIAYFSTTWIVPPAPASADGQTIFLFNGLEQSGDGANPLGPSILQPVLQWGSSEAGGGNYWSITNWYVGTTAVYQPLIQVNSGDVLQGVMTLTGQTGSEFSYLSSFVGYASADLTVTDIDELKWACETLECYGITQCSDFPNTPLTAFYDIELKVGSTVATSVDASFDWDTETLFTDCGQNCLVVSNDEPGGAVYVYYQQISLDLYFVVDKGTFGLDEVQDVVANSGGVFSGAFWVALDGFTVQQVTIDQPGIIWPTVAGPFKNLVGVSITPSATLAPSYDPTNLYVPQRILYPFDITFTSVAFADFPASGETPELLNANISIPGATIPQSGADFYLIAGADPYFTNIDPTQDNAFYLSQDLRVFTITPESDNTKPIGTVEFTFQGGSPTSLDTGAAYSYIQQLLAYFNANYSNPSGTDPFNPASSVLPDQSGALTGDSSVTPATANPANMNAPFNNYNFAIARVRLRGTSGSAGEASDVRVFFRVFVTQTSDTDYINTAQGSSNITYPSSPAGSPNAPTSPLPGTDSSGNINGCTIPFFAAADQSDLQAGGANNQTIEIPSGNDSVWWYFGCFLNVYDPSNVIAGNSIQSWLAGGTHHCIVAQIAFDDAPIENQNGVNENPENSDKLAQRNLQVTPSGNPGYPITHSIPQTFDIRPSAPVVGAVSDYLLTYPDELMIDWRNVPRGTRASIYWPQVSASSVIQAAAKLYPAQSLGTSDSHTIQCKATGAMTYIPIPAGTGPNFAGLITTELPAGIRAGDEFAIVVRRVTTRQPQPVIQIARSARADAKAEINWRYVVGTFQIKIPVEKDEAILPSEENLLAILKWRLGLITTSNRWYPLLQRYISIVASRVKGLGGDPTKIKPSQYGTANQIEPKGSAFSHHGHEIAYTGKVSGIRYDRFGDFDGFFLITESGHERSFWSREEQIEELVRQAWAERIRMSVFVQHDDLHRPATIILRTPRPLHGH